MSIIKGLITKDLLQLKSYRKTIVIFIIIFSLSALVQKEPMTMAGMLIVMMILGFSMFAISSFNYDETSKADRYILTLPLTKKEVVKAKYGLIILFTLVGSIIGTIFGSIMLYMVTKSIPNISEILVITLGGIFGMSFVESIQIPCIYKYGAEKGRIQFFIVAAIIVLLVGGVFFLIQQLGFSFEMVENMKWIVTALPLVLMIGIVLIYFVSYKIAYHIYAKKEV